jgi:hypothetical protein
MGDITPMNTALDYQLKKKAAGLKPGSLKVQTESISPQIN